MRLSTKDTCILISELLDSILPSAGADDDSKFFQSGGCDLNIIIAEHHRWLGGLVVKASAFTTLWSWWAVR